MEFDKAIGKAYLDDACEDCKKVINKETQKFMKKIKIDDINDVKFRDKVRVLNAVRKFPKLLCPSCKRKIKKKIRNGKSQ